jgi:hypothetical protein
MWDWSLVKILGIITILQLWWVAVWGVCYMGIEYMTKNKLLTEFWIYMCMLLIIYFILYMNPTLIPHLG